MLIDPISEAAIPAHPFRDTLAGIRDRLKEFVIATNPFYLLSALSMLAGCYLLGRILRPEASAGLLKPLILIGTLQVYELILIGLGLYLSGGRRTLSDGRNLLLLEILFLVDATYLGAESIVAGQNIGWLVAVVAVIATAAKAGLIIRGLGLKLTPLAGTVLALQLGAIFLLPALLSVLHRDAGLSQTGIYGAWWVVGLLLFLRGLVPPSDQETAPHSIRRYFLPTLGVAAFLPLVIRIFVAGWDLGPFRLFFLTPLVAGLAFIALTRARRPARGPRLACLLGLPALAIILNLNLPFSLECDFGTHWALQLVAPFRVTLLVAGLLYLYAARRLKVRLALLLAWPALFVAASGYSLLDADVNLQRLAAYLLYLGDQLVPRTPEQWGLAAIIASFVLLAVGAGVSLFKETRPERPAAERVGNP